MWIEFFGPPGVGKSTTRRALATLRSMATPAPLPGWRATMPESWDPFYEHAEAAFQRAMRRNREAAEPRWWSFQRHMARVVGAHRRPELVLLDDGLAQRGQSLAAADGLPADILRYYELMPRPQLLVVLTADADTILRRNRKRALEHGAHYDLSDERYRALDVVALALPILQRRGFNVLHLSALKPAEENARAIADALREAA